MFAAVFVLLYAAHLIADYPLQTDYQAAHKADRSRIGWRVLLNHATTHVMMSALALAAGRELLDDVADFSPLRAVVALVWIGVTHGLIDRRWPITWWMQHTGQVESAKHGGAAHIDQTAHATALVIAALIIAA